MRLHLKKQCLLIVSLSPLTSQSEFADIIKEFREYVENGSTNIYLDDEVTESIVIQSVKEYS